jgi:hypothetical protein
VFKKSISIELVKESAGTEENDNDSLSLAISLFVSFMMQLTWLFIVVGFFGIVIMESLWTLSISFSLLERSLLYLCVT